MRYACTVYRTTRRPACVNLDATDAELAAWAAYEAVIGRHQAPHVRPLVRYDAKHGHHVVEGVVVQVTEST